MAKLTQQERHEERRQFITCVSKQVEEIYACGALENVCQSTASIIQRHENLGFTVKIGGHELIVALECMKLVLVTFQQRDDVPGPGRLREAEGG